MKVPRRTIAVVVVLVLGASRARGGEVLPPDRAIEGVVDHYVDEALTREKVEPAPSADDATLVRRLTLDLAGRVPTAAEASAYAESTDPAKATRLVDRLMASPGFVRHQAAEF